MDALAIGRTKEEMVDEGVKKELLGHRTFKGDRPSLAIFFQELTPFTLGQLLSAYEHRTFVEGKLWGINSFDQYGVELGKKLARDVAQYI